MPRRRPSRICGTATVELKNPPCTWPEITAACAGAAPLNGTCVSSIPATEADSAMARWPALPMPAEAMVNPPGLAFAAAMKPGRPVIPVAGCTASTIGWKAH